VHPGHFSHIVANLMNLQFWPRSFEDFKVLLLGNQLVRMIKT